MISANNISPFCLLNGKMREQLFDYNDDELADFHKAVTPDLLPEVFKVVEEEYNTQHSTSPLADLSDEDCAKLAEFLRREMASTELVNKSPKVELLDGYIAISSSNLRTLDDFKDRLVGGDITWEHRIKKHDGVTIHSYVFNINEGSI